MSDTALSVFTLDVDLPLEFPPGHGVHVVDVAHNINTPHVYCSTYDLADDSLVLGCSMIHASLNTVSVGIPYGGSFRIVVCG